MLGNKRIMGQNILYYMERNNLERKDFAKSLGIPYSTLNEWINGNAYPRIDRIQQMADYFGIEKADLVEARSAQRASRGMKIPVYGYVAAGLPLEMIEDIIDYEDISMDWVKGDQEYFACTIKGDSMEPRMRNGDRVIVRKQSDVESGQTAIVAIDGQNATCKIIKKYHDGIELVPLNPTHQTRFFSAEEVESMPITILGKVVELRAKFE